MNDEILLVADVAKLEHLTTRTVSEKCRVGEFPGAYKTSPNGFWRIPMSSIEAYRAAKQPRSAGPGRIEPPSQLAQRRRANAAARRAL